MRRDRVSALALASGLALSGACSLHSIDYLGAGGQALGGSDGDGGTHNIAGSSALGGASAGGLAQAGSGAEAGTAASAGGEGSISEAGAAGAPEVPDCGDHQQTLDETDIDCGGRTCAPCADEQKCVTGTDCQSAICTNQVCQPATCNDLAVNGAETDLNCGGQCPPCALGQTCKQDADCSTKKCLDGVCESKVCQDGVLQDGCPLLVDNTPYTFSPASASSRCVDDNGQSVAEGNGMILYTCKMALHQTFWAVALDNGYFAFRSALSGKCLQVRGASSTENAVVEQATCSAAPEQGWKPSRVDAMYMQLINRLSGLALDVAGSSVDANLQAITQGKVDGSADTHWQLKKGGGAAYVVLSVSDDPSNRVHHEASVVTLTSDDSPSSHWKVVPGLYDARFITFQSRDEPGRYLRHAGFRLWCDTNDGSSQFKKDATFHFDNPLSGTGALNKSLESDNYSGRFLERDSDTVRLNPLVDSPDYKSSATWLIGGR